MKKTTYLQESDIHKTVKKALNEMYASRVNEVRNFNNVICATKQRINESNINRMLQWLKDCDCAFISAFRSELKDIRDKKSTYLGPDKDWEEGKRFTHEENRQKNKLMVAELLQLGYGVAKIKGVCPEGMTDESSEESYLVVNRDYDSNFLDNLLRIAEYYNQDSIYYKARGKTKGNLIGTNNCGWPGYHQNDGDSEMETNSASTFMSKLGNIVFSLVGKEALDFWQNMVAGRMQIAEDIHPLTRKVMGEALRSMRNN